MGKSLEAAVKEEAKARQAAAGKSHGRGKIASEKFTEAIGADNKGQTREIIGKAIGMSGAKPSGKLPEV